METILSLNKVSYNYFSKSGEIPALLDITFSMEKGQFVAIIGPSGCGKTTLLSIIDGLITPTKGTMNLPENIGYMLQHDHLFEWRSIYDNLTLGLEIKHQKTKENLLGIDEMLKSYGLYDFRNKKPSELSGGMRQRAALIRTLALNPELLLLDEPFSALDYQTRLSVSSDIKTIIQKEGKTALLVTHDLSEAISMADTIIVLSKRPGQIKCLIKIQLTVSYKGVLAARNAPEFKDYFRMLWEELHDEE